MLFPRRVPATGRSRRRHQERGRRRAVTMAFWPEELEARRLLSNVSWVGNGNDDLWSDPQNWSNDQVPGPQDDVTINQSGSFTIIYDATAGDTTIDSLKGSDALSITGGSLTIATTSTASPTPTLTLTGDLTIDGGSLIASGARTSVTASGPVTASYGTLSAQGGADFTLPGLTSFDGTGMTFSADGSGSKLDISGITSYTGTGTTIAETNGAKLLMDTSFTTLSGVSFTIDNTSDLASLLIDNLTSLTDGGLTVLGGSYAFPNLAAIDGSSLSVSGGGGLTLAGVQTYGLNNGSSAAFQATDTTSGGTLDLPALTGISGNNGLQVDAAGASSRIDLPVLTSFTANYSFAGLSVTQSATVSEPLLTALDGVIVTLDGTGKLPISQWNAYTKGSLSINKGDYAPTTGARTSNNSFTGLSKIGGSSIYVGGGGSLTLPAVTSYDPGGRNITFGASGSGAFLSLPNLASVSRSGSSGGYSSSSGGYSARGRLNFKAGAGGQVQVPALASITAGSQQTSVGAQAQGAGSLVNLSGVTTFDTYNGLLSATQGGTVMLGSGITSPESTLITVDGTGGIITPTDSVSLDQFTTLNYDFLTVKGGTYNLPNLTNIDNTGVSVSGGGSLTLPSVGSYTNSQYYSGTSLSATDTTSGGTLALPGLTTIASTYPVNISAAGSKSVIDLSALTSWTATGSFFVSNPSTVSVTQGGTVDDGSLTTLAQVAVTAGRHGQDAGQPVAEPHRRQHQGHRGRLRANRRRGDVVQRVYQPGHDRRLEPVRLGGRQPDPARRAVLHQQRRLQRRVPGPRHGVGRDDRPAGPHRDRGVLWRADRRRGESRPDQPAPAHFVHPR